MNWWTAKRVSTALSVLIHAAIAGLLAAIVIAGVPQGNSLSIDAIFGVEDEPEGTLEFGNTEIELEPPTEESGSWATLLTSLTHEMPESAITNPSFSVDAASSPAGHDTAGASTGSKSGELGTAGGTNGSEESGTTSFFGMEVEAGSVAFVIDASSSMTGPRFQRARKELATSLTKLKPSQRFFVVFYTNLTFPLFYPSNTVALVPAEEKTVRKAVHWLKRSVAQGGTEPQAAMAMALQLKPEVVFFLSDGQIPMETSQIIRQYNQGAVIHTITFGSDVGGLNMRQIADDNGGTYRFIPDGF